MKNKCLSMSLELSILGLTVRNDRRNVQLLWAQGHCVVVFPGCHGSLQTETLPQDASVGKNIRVLMTPRWGECSKLLVDWVLGPMAGNVDELCGCCDDPYTPRDLHNTHIFHPTCPNIRPKDFFRVNEQSMWAKRSGMTLRSIFCSVGVRSAQSLTVKANAPLMFRSHSPVNQTAQITL